MTTDARRGLNMALYVLFALSGIAGLIYQSIWTHYLKLFLGHAAYAQTLVLAIFMGGMALGAWLAGEWARRLRQPLMGYIIIELLLGVLGLGFDPIFRGMQAWAFDSAIPALASPLAIDLLKWGLSSLIILPQCVLLGATFPLMSSGLIRLNPSVTGGTLAWLYFTNSLGASFGVLLSGFVLIALVGLPGTLLTAGLLNFAVALGVWLLWAKRAGTPLAAEQRDVEGLLARAAMLVGTLQQCNAALLQQQWPQMLKDYLRDFLPTLMSAGGQELAKRLRASPCHAQLDAQSVHWVSLLDASSGGRWDEARELAVGLLPTALGNNPLTELLANQILLAELLTRGPAGARERLAQWQAPPSTVPFNYLRALAITGG